MGEVPVILTGDERDLVRAYQRAQDAQSKYIQSVVAATDKAVAASKRHTTALDAINTSLGGSIKKYLGIEEAQKAIEKQGNATFGAKAVAGISAVASHLHLAERAAQLLIAGFRRAAEERERLSKGLQTAEMGGLGSLVQLNPGDPKAVQRDILLAKKIMAYGGAGSLDEAGRKVFAFRSAGLSEQEMQVLAMSSAYLPNAEESVKAASAFQAAMGRPETGSAIDIISKANAVAAKTAFQGPELMKPAARIGGIAGMLGLSDEEVMAAIGIAGSVASSPEIGSTNVKAFLQKMIANPEIKKDSLSSMVAQISSQNMSPAELQEYLGGSVEALQGYQALASNTQQFRDMVNAAQGAQGRNNQLYQMIATAEMTPELRAAKAVRVAKMQADVAGSYEAAMQADFEAARAEKRTKGRMNGESETRIAVRDILWEWFGKIEPDAVVDWASEDGAMQRRDYLRGEMRKTQAETVEMLRETLSNGSRPPALAPVNEDR